MIILMIILNLELRSTFFLLRKFSLIWNIFSNRWCGWCRSNTKVGTSDDECEGAQYFSHKEPLAGMGKETKGVYIPYLLSFTIYFIFVDYVLLIFSFFFNFPFLIRCTEARSWMTLGKKSLPCLLQV